MQQVAAPFGCQYKPLRQPASGNTYPEKHNCWQKNGRFGFGEDEVAGYFKNDILQNQTCVSLDLGGSSSFESLLDAAYGDEEYHQSDGVLVGIHAQISCHACYFGISDVSSLCRLSAELRVCICRRAVDEHPYSSEGT
jgi:hypothetical protein